MKFATDKGLTYFYRIVAGAALIWTVVVICSAAWNAYHERLQTLELVKKEALANFNKDQAFRLWGTKHGGVYVPPTEQTPPNPYLSHIPDRDITLPSGKRLTLMNPAYMVRQMMADFGELYGIKGRITSLKPVNPANAPDAWEREALAAFEKDAKEFFEITDLNGQKSIRLMRPMVTTAGCLKCHSRQGYKEGDIRGGVGVIVPMAPYLKLEKETITAILLSHVVIWMLGSVVLMVVFYQGRNLILEQARSQEALAESEARLSLALDAANAAWWTWNFKTGETTYSAPYYAMLGYAPDAFPSNHEEWKKRVHPEDIGMAEAFLKKHLMEEKTGYRNLEMRMLTREGTWRWIAGSGKIVKRDADGNPVRLIGTNLDIDDRKQSEVRAEQLSRKNELILNSAGEGIYGVDVNDTIVFANAATADILGYTTEELIGRNSHKLFHHTKADGTPYPYEECPLQRSLALREVYRGVNEVFWAKNGEKIDVEHVNTPLIEDGRITGVVIVFRDIRERKKAEEEIRKLNEELEHRVKARTEELESKNAELDRLNKVFVNRELRMVELKERILELEKKNSEFRIQKSEDRIE